MNRRGFTLLEVLLALALLALVLSLVQGSYSGAARSRRIAQRETAEAHAAALVLQRFALEASMIYRLDARGEATGLIVGRDGEGLSHASFTTRVPAISGHSLGGDAEVGYFVEADEEGNLRVLRRETEDPDGDLTEGGDPYEMLSGVIRFEVLCYDGEEWLETWDSGERTDPPLLPRALSVEVAWGDEEDEEAPQRVYRTSTPVYASWEQP